MIEHMAFIEPMEPWDSIGKVQRAGSSVQSGESLNEKEGSLFSDILASTVQRVYDTSAEVGEKQYLLATGQLDDAHTLPIAQAKAGISIDLLVTLRNKALESYNELLKMNI